MTRDELLKEIHFKIDELPDKYLLEVLQYMKKTGNDDDFVKRIDKIIDDNRELLTKLAK